MSSQREKKQNLATFISSGNSISPIRPYDKSIRPSESIGVNLFAYGEGFHNYHHSFPWDYRCEELRFSPINFWGHWIDLFAKAGLAYDLRTASKDTVRARTQRTGPGGSQAGSKQVEHEY